MAKKDQTRSRAEETPKEARGTAAIQVDKKLAQWVRTIASHDGISQAAVVRDVLTPFLRTQMQRVNREIDEGLENLK
jgi:hypothetical protein